MNSRSNFLFQAVKSYEVLDKHSQIVTFPDDDISSPVRSNNNRKIAYDLRVFLLLFLRNPSFSIHLVLIRRCVL